MTAADVVHIQQALHSLDVQGWLLYSFRDTNPIASEILGLTPDAHVTRRWACMIPREGPPRGLVHVIEPHVGSLMPAEVRSYSSTEAFKAGLQWILEGLESVAMEYSPNSDIPVVGRVDAGMIELVRSLGARVVSSADLVAWLGARLDPLQIASARRAGSLVRSVMMSAFAFVRDQLVRGASIGEYAVAAMIMEEFAFRGMETDHHPIVAVNAHSANPHYAPTRERQAPIHLGDFLLIDLWGRESGGRTVYGDITWTGFVGESVPEQYAEVFSIVARARDTALSLVSDRFSAGATVTGAEVDLAARSIINQAGYADAFFHRTGHSITWELHGAGVNMDGFESLDTRRLVPCTSFSIEPGIYLPGRFGIRSEIDVLIDEDGTVEGTSEPRQRHVIPILAL